ncbi:hypothetical protein Poly30_49780 [Planctomycetes bacterium Poly30]|uniref:Uncharacterized protein n=2 Tax=Saltatorellus ferox TaxID=2528018 RepID=A0A518EZ99_9BACT|nr:hypothetical protein Poly30_49780 [Planctomycetes bacterium Poly30]
MYAAALSSGFFLAACSCEDGCDVGASAMASPSQMVGIDPGISSADVFTTPDSAMTVALRSLKEKKISAFLQSVVPQAELAKMRDGWKKAQSEPVSPDEDKEFQAFMGMATAEGSEEMLFLMVKPYLKDAQEQLQGVTMMLPMMAAGALENADVPAETGAMIGQLSAKLAKLDITDEDKAREAIGVFVKAARALDVETASEIKALSFEDMLGRVDIAYAGLIDILGVYDLSPQKTLESMSVKMVSTEGDHARMEMTFSLFGAEPQSMPFEMERIDGRWFPKPSQEAAEEPEMGTSRLAR